MRARWLFGFGGAALLACGALVGDSSDDGPARAPAEDARASDVADLDGGAAEACTPRTCAELGANCGAAADECGNAIPDCGTCSGTDFCGGGGRNKCGSQPCEAGTCQSGQCGAVSDGCNTTLQCTCAANEVCERGTCAPACIAQGACGSVAGVDCAVGAVQPGQHLYACSQTASIQQLPGADCTLCRKSGNNPPPGVFYCCP